MIPVDALHRLVFSLTESIIDGAPDGPSETRKRQALAAFAEGYDLDVQDFATLVRVASGEAYERPNGRPGPKPGTTFATGGIVGGGLSGDPLRFFDTFTARPEADDDV